LSAAREAILGRLRQAYARDEEGLRSAQAAVEGRIAALAPNLIPERGQQSPAGRVALFMEMATAVMADVRRLDRLPDVPAAVGAYLRQHNLPQRVVMAPEPLLDRCGWESQPLLRVRRGTASEGDATGVTLALAGVAETGTLVLASSADRPALLAYLPETSVVVVPAEAIDGAYEQAWARVRALEGGVPRSVNLTTGPSRTADIAQKLELGAHGPKRLLILIVDSMAG